MAKYDTTKPILVLVRRGRKGRGYSVSPVEDVADIAACADAVDLGGVIIEMLDDDSNPRVNASDIMAASVSPPTGAQSASVSRESSMAQSDNDSHFDDDDDDDADDDDDDDGGADAMSSIMNGEGDMADRAIMFALTSVLNKGRSMSSKKASPLTGSGGKRKKTGKSGRRR